MRKDNKDILIGYIATLPDSKCKEIYYLLTGFRDKYDMEFDLVKLTNGQYNKLIWLWGEDKTLKCINLLNDWLKEKGDKITKNISHYKQLIGWIENKYYQLYPATDKTLRFDSKIDTAWKAKRYIQRIPKDLIAYDSEVKYLVNRYGKDILP
jgi:hypothetical protein